MKELQGFSDRLMRELGWEINEENFDKSRTSILGTYMLLMTEIGEVGEEFRRLFTLVDGHVSKGCGQEEAFRRAMAEVKMDLGKELADCLAYITKFANFFDIDLEESFYSKMEEVRNRRKQEA
ncbi:MazG nucleotide pyrophosphohydrolase domain-containing protein [Indiicoccus explosivorum]|uniref:MazG nucleotide pyrophosphohydrolase domain-containing protein n=1 Tax=Indiicoccus explosivorum TaxID=1917864 RepID=UPI000B440832|nr:MazG nucleotide pyrophosphohydrolase domain-containing protein [Indiicoccus explosivorum]